jgi:hypothetical protein
MVDEIIEEPIGDETTPQAEYYNQMPDVVADKWAWQRKNDNALVRFMIGLQTLKTDDNGKVMEFGVPMDVAMRFYGFLSDESVKTKIDNQMFYIKMCELRSLIEDVRSEYADDLDNYINVRIFLENVTNLARDRMMRAIDGFDRQEMRTITSENLSYSSINTPENRPKGLLGRIGNIVRRRNE